MPIQDDKDEVRDGSRIAKVMARAGLCSRRDAEQWIAEGRVKVNGETLTSPAYNVSEADEVLVDGEPLRAPERTRLFLFHKPRGLVTTAKDPEGRPTIFDALPEDLPRVVAVGRLDINTEGLILLTNDGGLSRVLELPATGWLRRYRVRAHGEVTQEQLDALRNGITIDGIDYLGIDAKFERQQGSNAWLTMGLREGKNREIKRVLEHMGLSVNRLIRVSFGPFELGDLPEGELMEVRTRVLRDQLGPKLSKQAGANFDALIETPVAPPEPPRGDRPLRRPRAGAEPSREDAPRKRKHVSVLREEAREEAAGPRKRVTRTATADRKGREVKVERVSLVNPPMDARPKRRPAGDGFGPRKTPREGFEPRAEGASGERRSFGGPSRRSSGEGFEKRERAPRGEGASGERRGFGGPSRRPSGEGFEKRERAPRSEGASGGGRSFGGPSRRPSGEGFEKRERAPRSEGDSGERRSFGGASRRPSGEGFEKRERAPRSEGASGTGRSFGGPSRRPSGEGFEKRERAPRSEGDSGERRSFGGPSRRPSGEGFEKRERAPRSEGGSGERRSYAGASRRPSGEGFEKRERAPRGEGGSGERHSYAGPSRRPVGEGFEKRAPRGEGRSFGGPREGGEKRPPRSGGKPPARGGKPGGPKGPPRKR